MRPVSKIERSVAPFEVISHFQPSGDQPTAIADLEKRIRAGEKDVVLLGATGTGKSATTAWMIEKLQRPTLVMAPNKTLAAQLANEFRELLPNNAVEYFVSYYDYYQPEAYVPQSDTYIEKDSSINEEVERLRHSATNSLLTRRDVVVVASVSCIYGLGTPQEYVDRMVNLKVGDEIDRDALLRRFVDIQYTRNDVAFARGTFRVRGDTIEIFPVYEELAVRIEMFGDEIEALSTLHPLTGEVISDDNQIYVFPASHYVAGPERMERAVNDIEKELGERLAELEKQSKLLEAQRLRMRTTYDIEMLRQIGSCSGVENYSMHFDGREPGSPPNTLIDYFPDDFLLVIDESHVTVPQIGAMYEGDASRKRTLVDHGFRLPSALDNRPLKWEEFQQRIGQTVYLSATPGNYELSRSDGHVEQIIRPTGLIDPQVVVKSTEGQIDDLVHEIRQRTEKDERVLVTTLTKKMAEDLTDYFLELGIQVRYLHSDVDTLRRVELLRELRRRRVRRPGRHQPAARGPRPSRGLPGGDPRRRQGGLPALGDLPDPDHRPRGAQCLRPGPHVRGQDHPGDGEGHRGDQSPPGEADRLQHGAGHRSAASPKEDQRHRRADRPRGRRHRATARLRLPQDEGRQGCQGPGARTGRQGDPRRQVRQSQGRRADRPPCGRARPADRGPDGTDARRGGGPPVRDRGPSA